MGSGDRIPPPRDTLSLPRAVSFVSYGTYVGGFALADARADHRTGAAVESNHAHAVRSAAVEECRAAAVVSGN